VISNPKFRLVKNSLANVFRGGSASLVALIVPHFITRYMSPAAYGVWMLVLQVGAYVNFLDLGIQQSVGRFVAHAEEQKNVQHRNGVVSTALLILAIAALVAILCGLAVAAFFSGIFPQVPGAFVSQARAALLIITITLALGLPASVFNAVFVGLHRNEVPALIIAGRNLLTGIAVVLIAHSRGTILEMAMAAGAINLFSYGAQYLVFRRKTAGTWIAIAYLSRSVARELASYCKSLSIWSFSVLLVMGLDLTLVGIFDFQSVAYYAVAAIPAGFLTGMQNAIFSAAIPYTAMLHARGDRNALGQTVLSGARYGMFLLVATGLPLIFAPLPILKLWVGPSYALRAAHFLQILIIANIIRLSATPYAAALIGSGEQRLVTVSPLLEGFSNLLASILLGLRFGAIGVALGTLIGSVVGILGHYFYNMERTKELNFNRNQYFTAVLRPIFCVTPLLVVGLAWSRLAQDGILRVSYFGIAALASVWLIYRYGMIWPQRQPLAIRLDGLAEPAVDWQLPD
jgi:O-antigen/teichoic acid export membrane protein